ncbi:MAG: hypothetical protein LBK83_00240 [Treponema sp.]|jgi:hypothetical protein|nr:hypothetical protein [Treponema sp.]
MKKFLLLLVAVVLAGGLVLSCAQPSSYEVTLTPGSAPAVEGEKIVAEQLVNAILVKWDAAEDSAGYIVYRKEVGADGPIDATLVQRANPVTTFSPKGVPYYLDTGVKDGVTYQYGIASRSYKTGQDVILVSEVVWQAETDTSKFVKAAIAAEGIVALPATAPSYAAAKLNVGLPASGDADQSEGALLTFSGLVPGYRYTFQPQISLTSTPAWSNIGPSTSFTYNLSNAIGAYIDDSGIVFSEIVSTGADDTHASGSNYYQYYGFRLLVTYDVDSATGFYAGSYVIKQPDAVTGVPSGSVIVSATTGVSIAP